MSSFLNFSDVFPYIKSEFEKRSKDYQYLSGLNAWIRAASGVGDGLVLYSNPDYRLFSAAGDDSSIYGNDKLSGTIGKTWDGKPVYASEGRGYRPSPVITSLSINEDLDNNLARRAELTIKCFTLEQLNELTKYFAEPGFTLFLEWGWNTPNSLINYEDKLSVDYVSKYNESKDRIEKYIATNGHCDNYLGYITGNSISMDGEIWTITTKLTGYSDLSTLYSTNSNSKENKKTSEPLEFDEKEIKNAEDIGRKRFMMLFNKLPSNCRVSSVKRLVNNSEVTKPENFINFHSEVVEKINEKTLVDLPEDVNLIDEQNRYVRLGTLFDIMSASTGIDSISAGTKKIKYFVNYKNVPLTAFPNIFSLNKNKLFIPNSQTPSFTLQAFDSKWIEENIVAVTENKEIQELKLIYTIDNSVNDVSFPSKQKLNQQNEFENSAEKGAGFWGYLENLYVNVNNATSIIDNENTLMVDTIFNLLNSLSSAVGGLWNFQITELETDNGTELTIIDKNFVNDNTGDDSSLLVLDSIGANSILQSANLNIELPALMQNNIITKRLGDPTSTLESNIPENLYAYDSDGNPMEDKILNDINSISNSEDTEETKPTELTDEQKKELSKKLYTEQLTFIPKSKFSNPTDIKSDNVYDLAYVVAYDNLAFFSLLKEASNLTTNTVSPLQPIDFEFTIHGISGFRRSDKFQVNGIPEKFKRGFFQVTSITHAIQDMKWTTTIKGGFRGQ